MTTEEKRDLIIQEAKDAIYLLERGEKNFDKYGGDFVYVISAKWLREWKQYTCYERVIQGELPDNNEFGNYPPRKINQDIVITKDHMVKYPDLDDYRNVIVREDIEENVDYELVIEEAWKYFASRYEHITIKRPVHILSDGEKKVEVVLKQVWIVPMNNYLLRQIDHKQAKEFKVYSVQTSSHATIQDFKTEIVTIFNTSSNKHLLTSNSYYYNYTVYTVVEEDLNIWLLDPALDLRSFFGEISAACGRSPTYDYQIEFKGQYLEKNLKKKLSELSAYEDILFIDIRESSKRWAFVGDGAPVSKKCEFCTQYKNLDFECVCQEVAYCSKICQEQDKSFHLRTCKISQEEKKWPVSFPGFEDF